MNQVIWKFAVEPPRNGVIINVGMPKGAQVLSVGTQHGDPMVWALVDPDAERIKRRFAVMGTGWPAGDLFADYKFDFVGTFLVEHDALVFHVFVEREVSPLREFSR